MRRLALVLALLAASCSPSEGTAPTGPDDPSPTGPVATTAANPYRPCQQTVLSDVTGGSLRVERISPDNVESASASISAAGYRCARDVVVVGNADLDRIAIAAGLAAGLGGPLLLGDGAGSSLLAYEIDRLAPQTIWLVGDDVTVSAPEFTAVESLSGDNAAIAASVADLIDASTSVTLPAGGVYQTVQAALGGLGDRAAIAPSAPAGPSPAVPEGVSAPHLTFGTGASGLAWAVDDRTPSLLLAAAASAANHGGFVVTVSQGDLRVNTQASRDLRALPADVRYAQVLGGTNDATWQMPMLLDGRELPGGGFLLFPYRRIIAIYGNPNTTSLGILGEQNPADSVARARTLAAAYQADDGVVSVPAFEIITTVAAGSPGADGDYSNEMPIDQIRSWVDAAGQAGVYVILDLQPGRTDFLTQAKLYEDLLREPHVGLALDPEWRLLPDELPLRQIGHVEAAEVNEVSAWLAELVRDHHLPQKLFLLHQFQDQMLRDRETIETPPELAVVIQMDGQGLISNKYATWNRITAGWEGYGWRYGWKNFYDEDVPGPIPPGEVLELVPAAVYVSYQ